jgi:heme exporter protein CcmD
MTFAEFVDMSGYGTYVWSAYAIALGGLVLNVWLARRQLRLAREEARRRLAMQESP